MATRVELFLERGERWSVDSVNLTEFELQVEGKDGSELGKIR